MLKKKISFRHIELISMASLGVIFLLVFSYLPMTGLVLAFKEGNRSLNIFNATINAPWTMNNVTNLFTDDTFWGVLYNTIGLNVLALLFTFPAPIIFALLLNEINSKYFKTSVKMISSMPHFLSWIIFGGIVLALTDMTIGVTTPLFAFLGIAPESAPIDLGLADYFWGKMIIVSLMKGVGWGSIIYSAAITGINKELYESAEIDGANRFQRMYHITLPLIAPTITVFLLLNISGLLANSFEQFYIFQNTANLSKSEVLATYIYSQSFTYRNYSTGAAIGLFESVVSVILLVSANFISKKTTGRGLF